MDYSEIKNADDSTIAQQDAPTRQAEAAIRELMTRKGFDHWWENLDKEIQDDIFDEIRSAIRRAY